MQNHPTRYEQNDQQDRQRLCGRTENAEGGTNEHTGQDMRRSPGERRRNIDGIEPSDRHSQHAGEERNEGADARCEAGEKNTLVAMTREKGLAALNQFGVPVQWPEAKNLAMVPVPQPE